MKKSVISRRIQRIRKKLKKVNKNRFRLSVHRSSKNIFAQIIDDKNNKTIVSASSIEKDKKNRDVKYYRAAFSKKSSREKDYRGIF